MRAPKKKILFYEEQLKGSRLRCVLLTSKSRETVREFLNAIVSTHATIDKTAQWQPRGLLQPAEFRFDQDWDETFVKAKEREEITTWWLKNRSGNATTPTWDLVSECTIRKRRGLILVEAKAHVGELGANDGSKSTNKDNRQQIADAIDAANTGLGGGCSGWQLSRDSHYQLSNRFAFAWKLASLGVPVVLIYLGFLKAWDMQDGNRKTFNSHKEWRKCLLAYADKTVPKSIWRTPACIEKTPLIALIRSCNVEVSAGYCGKSV